MATSISSAGSAPAQQATDGTAAAAPAQHSQLPGSLQPLAGPPHLSAGQRNGGQCRLQLSTPDAGQHHDRDRGGIAGALDAAAPVGQTAEPILSALRAPQYPVVRAAETSPMPQLPSGAGEGHPVEANESSAGLVPGRRLGDLVRARVGDSRARRRSQALRDKRCRRCPWQRPREELPVVASARRGGPRSSSWGRRVSLAGARAPT
jgi:hypothetical protein